MKYICSSDSRIFPHLIYGIIVILISGIAISCSKKDEYAIRVLSIIGKASLISANNTIDLKENDVINIGDTILTGEKTSVILHVGNQSAVRIYENSKFIVNSRTVDAAGDMNNSDFGLGVGKILVVIKKLARKGSFSVSTPTSVVAVRGTEFTVDSYNGTENPATKLDVIDGTVEIRSKIKAELTDNLTGGETITLAADIKIKEKSKIETQAMDKLKDDLDNILKKVDEHESKTISAKAEPVKVPDADAGNIIKPVEKKTADVIDKKPPVLTSETQIRNYYSKLERISLDDGSVVMGAIISQNKTHMRIHTVNGVISIPKGSVVNVVMQ